MNKNTISWTHYIYATITASVLAYVTVMDTSKESDDSATNPTSREFSSLPQPSHGSASPFRRDETARTRRCSEAACYGKLVAT